MSVFMFATCERQRALRFLEDLYPSARVSDSGAVAAFLDLLEADIVRLQDPAYHSPARVVGGTYYDTRLADEVHSVCSAMHGELMAGGKE